MNHFKALTIKFIATLALLYIVLGLFNGMSFGNVFLISLILGLAAYILGDMMILPRTNNMVATMADFGLSLLIIWLMSESLVNGEWFAEALTASIGIALFEYMFHKYVSNNVINEPSMGQNRPTKLQYQAETAEDLTPRIDKEYYTNDDNV